MKERTITCDTNGHIYGVSGRCVFCGAEKPATTELRPEAFLKEGETVAECLERNRRDIVSLMGLLAVEKLAKEASEAERDTLKAALEQIANGGPLTGQRTGPMKMYQAQALARAALAASLPPQETEK